MKTSFLLFCLASLLCQSVGAATPVGDARRAKERAKTFYELSEVEKSIKEEAPKLEAADPELQALALRVTEASKALNEATRNAPELVSLQRAMEEEANRPERRREKDGTWVIESEKDRKAARSKRMALTSEYTLLARSLPALQPLFANLKDAQDKYDARLQLLLDARPDTRGLVKKRDEIKERLKSTQVDR